MSYLVLARKYRPQNFDSLAGQSHITEILKKAIETNKIAHAYLFCGPRGVGKTSCARILAKALNCVNGPTLNPCGECAACKEIAKGNSFDVLEIDGASNRGIDEIRGLRENVKFAPSYGKYKIYIVDEVHMLTAEAFNALLKTLEEPPEHVKFIFATTSVNKVPDTIISRCQKFDFKRISSKIIVDCLIEISKSENIKIDQNALYSIAKAAQGSLRDALSIIDQLSALSEKNIKVDDVYSMLGLVETDLLFSIADAICQKNSAQALRILDDIIDRGKDINQLTKDIIEHFRNLMITRIGGKTMGKLLDYPLSIKEAFLNQSEKFSINEILSVIDALIEAQEKARVTESLRMPLEVAFAKLTYNPEGCAKTETRDKNETQSENTYKFSPAKAIKSNKGQIDISGKKPETKQENVETANETEEITDVDIEKIKRLWDSLTFDVSREKMSVATFLQSGIPISFNDNKLCIGFKNDCAFQKEYLEDPEYIKLVERIFSAKLNTKIIVNYSVSDACEPLKEAPAVQNILNTFKGKVINRWHEET